MAEIIPGPGRLFIAPPGTPVDAPEADWKLIGETFTGGIVTSPWLSRSWPRTLSEMMAILDRITIVIVCHPDNEARVLAALDQLRATGPLLPVKVVTNPALGLDEMLTMRKATTDL